MRYLAGYTPQIADAISVGIGDSPESATSQRLDFEIVSVPIRQVGVDLAGRRVIFKVTIPQEVSGLISEVALWSDRQTRNLEQPLTLIDEATEVWEGGTWGTGSRVTGSTLVLSPAASAKDSATLYNFSRELETPEAITAAFVVGANVASIELDFGLDNDNYFRAVITSPAAGYNIVRIAKRDFIKTGVLDWTQVNYLRVSAVATSAGAGEARFDAIRADYNSTGTAEVMVARVVLDVPTAKDINEPLDIEYPLVITI